MTAARLRPRLRRAPAHRPLPGALALILPSILCTLVSAAGPTADARADTPADSVFGRLFFTPGERRALDQPAAPPPAPALPASTAAAAPRHIDGFVRHSSGEATLWLDGTPGPLPAGLRAAPFPALELIPANDPQRRLRIGDFWQAPPARQMADDPDPRPPQ